MDDPNNALTETPEPQTTDYLGKPSPLAFKNQPALPSGGGSIGVSTSPTGTFTGGSAINRRRPGMGGAPSVDIEAALKALREGVGGGTPDSDVGDASGGAPGVFGADPATIGAALTALSAPTMGIGLAGLASAFAGAPMATANMAPVDLALSAARGINAPPLGIPSPFNSNLTAEGVNGPVNIAPTYSGLLSALANAFRGDPNFVALDPDSGRQTAAPEGISTIGSSLAGLTGPTGGRGQASLHAPTPTSDMQAQQAPRGVVPNAPDVTPPDAPPPGPPPGVPSDQSNPGEQPGPTGTGGAGGGGGGTFICTALHKRGLLDDETLQANHRFAMRMTRAEYSGYAKWAKPLTAWAERHPLGARVLLAALGWMPRCYMKEITQPGSSRIGRVILYLGLKVCARLGAPRPKAAHA